MKKKHLCSLFSSLVFIATSMLELPAHAASGFLEGSSLEMKNRLIFEQLDYQRGDTTRTLARTRSDKARESGYGLMLNFRSGYTAGAIGLGLDAHAYGAANLGSDADSVRSNPRYLAKDAGILPDKYGRAGAAVKVRWSKTELKYGEMRTNNPIFHSSDSRLLPETQRGWLLTSQDIDALDIQAGYFTKWTDRNSRKNGGELLANYSGLHADYFAFVGGAWKTPVQGLNVSSYLGRYENAWKTWYLGSFYKLPLNERQALSLSLNLYHSTDTGRAQAGEIDNTTWSLMASYSSGVHKFGLGYQKVHGDTPFDYVNRGSIWLENAMQLSDFNAPGEQSWQVRYDVDLGPWLTPGLTAGVAYTRGGHIDYTRMNSIYVANLGALGAGGSHWERDMILRYVVPLGQLKGLQLQLRYNMHRANKAHGELNVNQVRLQTEWPINIF